MSIDYGKYIVPKGFGDFLSDKREREKQSKTSTVILLDMDGVICNFIEGLIETHRWPISHDSYSSWNHHRTFGLSDEDMWAPTNDGKWWTQLNEYPWAKRLLQELMKLGEVVFCTSPNRDATCPSQKVEWLRSKGFMWERGINYQIGKQKELNAKSGAILIDDSDDNVKKYRDHGGKAILFPMPWNENRHVLDDKVAFVIGKINELNCEEDILEEALRITSGDRQASYGPPDQDFQRTAAMWSAMKGVPFEAREVAMFMIALKLSRETHQRKRDNAVDLAGYARCLDICNRAAVERSDK